MIIISIVRTVRSPIERRKHLLNSVGLEEQRAPPYRPYLPLAESPLKGPLCRLTPPLTWAPASWFATHQEGEALPALSKSALITGVRFWSPQIRSKPRHWGHRSNLDL